MKNKTIKLISSSLLLLAMNVHALPSGFVYLRDIAPSIEQDIRYASNNNLTGRPLRGYHAAECIITYRAATALKHIQEELQQQGLALRVYDCYRPQMAVRDLEQWAKDPKKHGLKDEYYPNVSKQRLFSAGYFARYSSHSFGSTVDLTIIGLDMGTDYDFLDRRSFTNSHQVNQQAASNRQLLKKIMSKHGFYNYKREWWHYTLRKEPFKRQYFNFPIVPYPTRISHESN